MIYVLDAGPLILMFKNYYPDRFPSLWKKFDDLRDKGNLISVREVANEIERGEDRASEWARENRSFFEQPTDDELRFVSEIFKERHFQSLISKQSRLKGNPVADPFVIAKAKCIDKGCVVTTEIYRKNAAKIPNVCEHFNIECRSVEELMEEEGWVF